MTTELTTQNLINYCSNEVNDYINEMMSSSRDSIFITRAKCDTFSDVARFVKDIEIDDQNLIYFKNIVNMLRGIGGIKGISNVEFVREKIVILMNHISFVKDINS